MKTPGKAMRLRALALLVALAGSAAAQTWEQTAWIDTTYYRADFRAVEAGEAVLSVAAADRYTIWLNGDEVGADSVWSRAASYDVALVNSTNRLAIRVVNEGRGSGLGVLALVSGDSLRVETTANAALTPWYWSGESQAGEEWTTARVNNQSTWGPVQGGDLNKGGIEGLPDTTVQVIAGLAGGIDVGHLAGALALGPAAGVNLARGRPSNEPDVTDGIPTTSWDPPTNAVNYFAAVDLQARRRVDRVRILTRGPGASQYEANAVRGYSVQVSDDQITWAEVAEVRDIEEYAWSEARFEPVSARHVRIVIVELDPTTSPRVAEMEVFGVGYRREGVYTSEPAALAAAAAGVNPGRLTWEGATPVGTALSVQVRTAMGADELDDPEAGWGEPMPPSGSQYPGREPAALIQYRVTMTSEDGVATPSFGGLRLEYDGERPVSGARAHVTPRRVPMGVDTTFTYAIQLEHGTGDVGVERLELVVPGRAGLDESAPVAALVDHWQSTPEVLTLIFSPPLTDVEELQIPIRTRTHAALHAFRAYLYGPGSDNPLNAIESDGVDPVSGEPLSWTVSASTSAPRVLSRVTARPPVLTPNGDGVNDVTVIEFELSRLDVERQVEIRICDLGGAVVRRLAPVDLAAGEYPTASSAGPGGDPPGQWDGRDDSGRPVPPGLYVYRIDVDLDGGDESAAGVVGVAY